MNVNHAKFQKSLIVEQFQGNYLKICNFIFIYLLLLLSSVLTLRFTDSQILKILENDICHWIPIKTQ